MVTTVKVPEPFEPLFAAAEKYVAALFKDFKEQIVFASAAYNSGAPAIKRFLARNRGLPFDEMVESIAYNEGRNYARLNMKLVDRSQRSRSQKEIEQAIR